MFISLLLVFLLGTVTGKTLYDLQKQHFQLQQNQIKILERLRTVTELEHESRTNATPEDLVERLEAMEELGRQLAYKVEALSTKKEEHNESYKSWKITFNWSNYLSIAAGATFIRWGRKDCPANRSRILYSVSVGGSYYGHTGGATTYLCLHKDPQRLNNLPHTYAFLYGGEYDSNNGFGNGLRNGDDMPCAVCQSKTGSQKLMIPARIECLPGWTKQYAGYLGTTRYGHPSQKEYICVDEKPQAATKGHRNDNGALVVSVKAVCGSLPCPPFKNGDSVTCVACTK